MTLYLVCLPAFNLRLPPHQPGQSSQKRTVSETLPFIQATPVMTKPVLCAGATAQLSTVIAQSRALQTQGGPSAACLRLDGEVFP